MAYKAFSAEFIRERHGLSNLMAFFGSGQSELTWVFFMTIWALRLPKTAEEMIDLLDEGVTKRFGACVDEEGHMRES